jgi:hypothetical protein
VQIKLNPVQVGAATFLTVVRLAHSQTLTFGGCSPGQAPVGQRICDTGATAIDAADGNLTTHVVVSPPMIPLNKPPGTRMKMVYSVSDYGMPRLQSEVERIIEIISPCAPAEFFCKGECTKMSCDLMSSMAAVVEEDGLENRPPTLYLLDGHNTLLQTEYAKAASLPLLRACEASHFANAGIKLDGNMAFMLANASSTQLACGVYALAADGSVITGVQAAVTQSYCMASSQCATCATAGFEAGLCLPGIHVVEFSISTASGVSAVPVQRAVRVAETAQVQIMVQIPYSGTLQQAEQFALSVSGNAALVRGIISAAESEVRSAVKAQASASSISDLAGRLDSVIAKQAADDAEPVVIITVSVSFCFVPGLDVYVHAQATMVNSSSQSGSTSYSQLSHSARRRLMEEPFSREGKPSKEVDLSEPRIPVNGWVTRQLQQAGGVSGLGDVLSGVPSRAL